MRRWTCGRVGAGLAGLFAVAASAACGSSAASDADVRVATGFYPLTYVAQRVAGDLASVENLTQPGDEPHDLELPIAETATLAEADLVVHLDGFQPDVDESVEQNATGVSLDAADVVDLVPLEEHEHGAEEGGETAAGHDHEAGEPDPHFWQDPLRMADLGDGVARALAEIDPGHAEDYRANAAALRSDLEALDTAYADGLASCARSTVVVSHDAFGYLGKYGLTLEPIAGLSPDAEPTPADLQRLQELIRSQGVTTVFAETLASPALAETLAGDLGVATGVLDPVEGLGDRTAEDDYLSLMRANLSVLQQANGC